MSSMIGDGEDTKRVQLKKCCKNCKWWDTFLLEQDCYYRIRKNNPFGYLDKKYDINRESDSCSEWYLSTVVS